MKTKVKIKGLQPLIELPENVQKAVKKVCKEELRQLANVNQKNIAMSQKPDGSAQQENDAKTFRQKESLKAKGKILMNKPLFRKGILADASNWRVSIGKKKATLRPPKEREAAVHILKTKGYITVVHQLPKDFEEKFNNHLQKELDKIDNKKAN